MHGMTDLGARPRAGTEQQSFEHRGHGVRVSCVIPTLNEAENISWVLERIPAVVDEVLVVDGRSTDGTVAEARRARPDVRVIDERRPGKGTALRAGFAAARGDFIVMIDADGSMHPAEIDRYVAQLQDRRRPEHPGTCQFVKGTRFAAGGQSVDISVIRHAGNDVLRRIVNRLYGVRFTDLCYGLCAFRRDSLQALGLTADGFEIETEIAVRAVKAGLRIGEVPSFERSRLSGDSNLSAWRDGRRVLRTLVRERFTLPPRAFAAPTEHLALEVGIALKEVHA
jgi:glycosyltransferase involved in cell wall biosynthesis